MSQQRSTTPVLVGVDGSPGSLAAVELGAWEAKRRRAPLHLVNGYQGDTPHLGYGWVPYATLGTAMRDAARDLLSGIEVATHAAHPGLTVRSTVVAGGGASALVELSRDASLVLVGSRGHGGFADLLLGSVAAQVVTHAHAPVIVVRPPTDDPHGAVAAARVAPGSGPVVVGIDGSPASSLALQFALDEAAARQASLVAIYVWSTDPLDNLRSGAPYDPGRAEAEADRMVAEAVAGWTDKYPDTTIVRRPVHHLNPTWTLMESSRDASLLVVGSRGRGGFARLLLGSVSRELAARAYCPVAIVRS